MHQPLFKTQADVGVLYGSPVPRSVPCRGLPKMNPSSRLGAGAAQPGAAAWGSSHYSRRLLLLRQSTTALLQTLFTPRSTPNS